MSSSSIEQATGITMEHSNHHHHHQTTDEVTFTEQFTQSNSDKLEPMAIADSAVDVKVVHELFQSPAEPITDSYKPEPMAIADSVDGVKVVHELFESPEEPITDSYKPEPMAVTDSVDDVKVVHELFQSPAEPVTDSYKPEPMVISDSVDDVKVVHELFQSPAEPITDSCKPEPMADTDSVDDVKVHELFQSPAEPVTDSYKPEPMAVADSVDDVKVVQELSQSNAEPITDFYKPEPMAIADSVDDVKVVQELSESNAEPRTDFSGPDVNASPNSELKSSDADAETDLNFYEHKMLYQRSESTCSDIAENDGIFCGPSSDNCTGELEMENEDLIVVFYPDQMVYRGSYCTDCVLTFTSSCIKIEGSTFCDDDITLRLQWGVQDILSIKSQMYEVAGMAMVTIHVHTEDTIQAVNGESTSGDEIKFTIIGNNWYGRQEAVTYLNDKYKTLWSNMLESEDSVNRDIQASLTKYFPNFDQPFEDVIYPKGDVDAVSISKRDVDLLLPDTFVNDTVIDFYIKYLKDRIKPEEKHRFHFFNSFFFRKLADPEKGPLDASEGKVAFQRVKKWTRKVNLFEKDYVFIPVNYGYHWSLLVLCHLGEVATCKDEDATKLNKVSCVLHMDSIRGTHTGLKDLLQSYLKEEWKARQQEASEDIVSRFDDLRFISLELPQQPNSSDCGLFLLHYVELFLEQAPLCFNPFHITKSENFLSADWFLPAEASLKRTVVQRLVYDILEQPAPPSMAANEDNNNIQPVNFFAERCNPSMVCQSSQDDQRIEISLLPSLSMANEPCFAGPTESYKPVSEPGSFLGMQFPSFNESMFDGYKIQEDAENGGQYIYSSTEIDLQQDNGISPDIPYTSLDFKSRESWHQNGSIETSPQTSISGCEESLEVINGNNQSDQPLVEPVKVLDDNDNDNGDPISQPRSPLMDLAEMLHDNDNGNQIDQSRSPFIPVEMRHDNDNNGSLKEPVEIFHGNGNGNQDDQPRSPLMGLVEVLDGNGNSNSNGNDGGLTLSSNFFDMQVDGPTGSGGAPGLESDGEQHPTKKMRMTESLLEGGPACS